MKRATQQPGDPFQTTRKVNKISRYCKPEALKELENSLFEKKRTRHPNIPQHYLVKDQYRDDTANSLTKCIIPYIQTNGGQCERINTTGRPIIDRQTTFTDVTGRIEPLSTEGQTVIAVHYDRWY